jgi:hypothetical protein
MRARRRDAGDTLVWVILVVLAAAALWFFWLDAPVKTAAPTTQGGAPKEPPKASMGERLARDADAFADHVSGGLAVETGKRMEKRIGGFQQQQRQRGVPEKEPDAEKK